VGRDAGALGAVDAIGSRLAPARTSRDQLGGVSVDGRYHTKF